MRLKKPNNFVNNEGNMSSNYTFTGKIVHGEHAGRTLGFPSANFDTSPKKGELKLGVHLCQTILNGQHYYGLAYFGPRYVHGEFKNSFEVYLYDFSGSLYDQNLTVEILDFIREPQKMSTLDDVKTQLTKDKAAGLELIHTLATPEV